MNIYSLQISSTIFYPLIIAGLIPLDVLLKQTEFGQIVISYKNRHTYLVIMVVCYIDSLIPNSQHRLSCSLNILMRVCYSK